MVLKLWRSPCLSICCRGLDSYVDAYPVCVELRVLYVYSPF